MPNWCVGTLKVRGKIKDLKRFIVDVLQPVTFFGDDNGKLELNEGDGYFTVNKDGSNHIKHTYRGFVEDLDLWVDFDKEDEVKTIALESKFAWDINAYQLLEVCQEFDVDMKIYAFERGMQFNRNIEIVDGEIVKNENLEFDDYLWDSICPNMGG